MNKRTKITAASLLGLLLILAILLSGPIFRIFVKYSEEYEREIIQLVDRELKSEIESQRAGKNLDFSQILHLSRTITNQKLKFTFKPDALKNPNAVEKIPRANCVGYAAMFTSIASYLIDIQDSEQEYRVRHIVGKLFLFNIDIHPKKLSFFKDHDYCEIKNLQTGQIVLIDPSLSDYTWINRVSTRSRNRK